jgi:hypothetical protein
MKRTHRPEPSLATAQHAFHTVTAGVSGLYIATHSVKVTMIGTAAAIVVAGSAAWLLRNRQESDTQPMKLSPASGVGPSTDRSTEKPTPSPTACARDRQVN